MDVEPGTFYLGGEIDPKTGERTEQVLLYDAPDLTTHGVIVGMTGSGKTGLGLGMMEEALLNGVATLMIDPKGDMGNLLLLFPELRPEDFRPWIDEAAARREGTTPEDLAAKTAESWKEGLAGWDITPERIAKLRDSAPMTIYTPGSTAGVAVNVLGSLDPPDLSWDTEAEVLRDEIEAYVSSLLTLAGVESDPVSGREHVLLANIIEAAWREGRGDRPGGSARPDRPAAVPQAGGVRGRCVLPGEGPHRPRHETQRAGGLALVRRLARGGATRHRRHALSRGQTGCRHPLSGPPLRQRAPVRGDSLSLQAGHLDAAPVGDLGPACPGLHGRDVRLLPADGGTSLEEADPHPAQAGAGLRCRVRRLDPEPGRPRLQGDVQRRNLDDRPTPDRARQGPDPRGDDLGGRGSGHRSDRPADLRPGQSPVRDAQNGGQATDHLHHPLGYVLSGRPADPRLGGEAHGGTKAALLMPHVPRAVPEQRRQPCLRACQAEQAPPGCPDSRGRDPGRR